MMERWRCGEESCDSVAVGMGSMRGLAAVGWNVEQGGLYCPCHRTDRPTLLLVLEEVHKLQGVLGLSTVVSRVVSYLGAPTVREPQPGEVALWPDIEPGRFSDDERPSRSWSYDEPDEEGW